MTPEERAVIEAASRVNALAKWDDPGRLLRDALLELDAALVVHERTAEPHWWQGPKPALPIKPPRWPDWLNESRREYAEQLVDELTADAASKPRTRAERIEEALRGLLICVEQYTDADLSALGMKRTSVCIVEAKKALEPA